MFLEQQMSCDTEDCSNDAENLALQTLKHIRKCIQIFKIVIIFYNVTVFAEF